MLINSGENIFSSPYYFYIGGAPFSPCDGQYNFVVLVTERLLKFYALYDVKTPLYATGDKEW
jgi:hypothetical protein